MRIFKGIENIHSVIDQHEMEWRKEQGEPVEELPKSFTPEEIVRRRLTQSSAQGSGRFSADRFLGASKRKSKSKPEPKDEDENENNVEVVSVIKHKDDKPHSWLYNEVLKAINDAAGNDRRTKIVAVFIPVVQNGKEFEDLPVDVSVTLPPVTEEEIKIEELINPEEEPAPEIEAEPEQPEPLEVVDEAEEAPTPLEEEPAEDFNLLPEGQDKPDAELAEAFSVMEEKLDEALEEQQEQQPQEDAPQIPEDPDTQPEEIDEPIAPPAQPLPELGDENEDEALEVPAGEVLNFAEFPVITEESDAPVDVDDVLEDVTPAATEDEPALEENEEPAPLDGPEDDSVFDEPMDAIKKLSDEDSEDSVVDDDDEEEVIHLDFSE
ncbi:MAG: hypothetical protein IJU31_05625 [Synergistaceae bacterium]|nr:hypothetical protein [Synergistaceae bacterium]